MNKKQIAVIGAGPAGLKAAEVLAGFGYQVQVFERMPTAGRKFLMAGRGGLNLTHTKEFEDFVASYGEAQDWFSEHITKFKPEDLRSWADGLGAETFVGTSGRVFPKAMKASPLLRAWLRRLEELGVTLSLNHKWRGWFRNGNLWFETPSGDLEFQAEVTVLALGGASWPKLGSNGAWIDILNAKTSGIAPFQPSNMGFDVNWSAHLQDRFAGHAVKNIGFSVGHKSQKGELILTRSGIEGGLVYAFSSLMREQIDQVGKAEFKLDLCPNFSQTEIVNRLSKQGKKTSSQNRIRKALGLQGVKAALVEEVKRRDAISLSNDTDLAHLLKNLSLTTTSYQGLERAISSSGGLMLDSLDQTLMLKDLNGVFACGEMLDWEAPTGGYLLQGCFSTAVSAALGVKAYLEM